KQVIARIAPEIIHAHCVLHSSALLAWQAAKRGNIPFVLNTIMSPRSGFFWKFWYEDQARRMMNEASCVIAISNFEREILVKAGLNRNRVTILPPAVDLEPFKTPLPSILSRFGLENKRVIVSLGRLAYGKRVDRLIHAMSPIVKKHLDARLLIIGPDYGD